MAIQLQYDFDLAMEMFSRKEFSKIFDYSLAFAEAGDADAQCMIGTLYQLGSEIPLNNAEALKWYRRAADQGHPVAWNNLGGMFDAGIGVPKDLNEAEKCYRKAYSLGYEHVPEEYSLKIKDSL